MKTVLFTPRAAAGWKTDEGTDVPATFTGTIELKIPDFFERQKLKSLLVTVVAQDGEADIESIQANKKTVNVMKLIERMSILVKESVPFYQKVDLVNLKTGAEHKSFDDLSMDHEAEGILQEVAQTLAGGLSISKN